MSDYRTAMEAVRGHLPLFPLPGVVFIPHTLLPLHVFEPRYRKLAADVVGSHGMLAVPQLAEGWESDYDGRPPVEAIFGVGKVVRHQELPDGRSNMVILGLGRARMVEELETGAPYRVARVDLLDETGSANAAQQKREVDRLRMMVGQLVSRESGGSEELAAMLSGKRRDTEVIDLIAHMVLRQPDQRQAYLNLDSVMSRCDKVMAEVVGLLEMGTGFNA